MTARARKPTSSLHITHPDKVMWPATRTTPAITKQDLAEYYLAAAERMLPHLAGRPISVVRAPDGIEGQHFFQRHASQGSKAPTISVAGEERPFLTIETVEDLVRLAQSAVLEIHPWGSKKGEPDAPERVIIDLDPAPDVDFSEVIAAAKDVRKKLLDAGLMPFVKTTGGKGLHVVAAVKGTRARPLDWARVKAFARDVCAELAAAAPERYVATMAKKARNGRIFLDYLRNDRTATAVAPWSPRARPGAPIATPIGWSQLRAGFDPHQFHLGAMDCALKRADPWKDLARSAAPLPVAES